MPAVTVDDLLTLPRIAEPDAATATDRAVRQVTTAPRGFEGEGFPVRRAFQGVDMADRRSYDIADQALNRYDASYRQWSAAWNDGQKRSIVNTMLTDLVNALQAIRGNF